MMTSESFFLFLRNRDYRRTLAVMGIGGLGHRILFAIRFYFRILLKREGQLETARVSARANSARPRNWAMIQAIAAPITSSTMSVIDAPVTIAHEKIP